jgi:AcrR family transcriptional regulator
LGIVYLHAVGRPREHNDATGATLLRAAEALLAEGGPEALSIRRVSDAAGTSTRAVYSVFGSKEGLRSALYQAMFRDLRQRLIALRETDDPVADLMRAGLDGFRAQALAHPNLFRLAFEWPERRTKTTDVDRREALATFDLVVHRVQRAAGGRLGGAAARRLAVGFHALCQGLASGELAGILAVNNPDMRQVWREALANYVRGFTTALPGVHFRDTRRKGRVPSAAARRLRP